MTQRKKSDNGFIINEKFCFSENSIEEGMINIHIMRGDNMRYGQSKTHLIDFPGEYDLEGMNFTVYEDQHGKLNYLIKDHNDCFAIVQSPNILESKDFDDVKTRYYIDQKMENAIEKGEYDGEKVFLQ